MAIMTSFFKWVRTGCFVLFCGVTSFSHAFGLQHLSGHVPKAATVSPSLGAMDTSQTLDLAIGLPLRNTDQLDQLIKDLYNPSSPSYRHFLTSDQFTAQFGPSPADYQAVQDFAAAHHLNITRTHTNRFLVDVQGSVDDIQKTFHVHLNRYQRRDGSEFHAPDQEPSVDLDTPLAHISGLENHEIIKPAYVTGQNNSSSLIKPASGSGQSGEYLGVDFRNAYLPCIAASNQGAGQTVALVEFDRYKTSDITSYVSAASFLSPTLNNIGIDGFNASSGAPVQSGDDGEVCLDIEMILCMAQSAVVNVYELPPNASNAHADDLLNAIATSNTAKQISCSWTGFGDGNTAAILSEYVAQGQAFFQAAGDLGAYVASDPETTVPSPIDLTSNMTVVGGTQLTTGSSASYTSEAVWNSSPGPSITSTPNPPNEVGSGGICTGLVPIPTYQVPFDSSNSASSSWRNIPDISMVAINIELYVEGSHFSSGGTSAAAPLWAGMTALINQQAAAGNKGPVGFLNPYLYTLANNGVTYAADFHDVTSGNNNYWGTVPAQYAAGTGYDLATGLGSPKCNLVADLVGALATHTVTPTPTITPTPTNTGTPTNTPLPPTTSTYYVYPQPAHGQVTIAYNSAAAQSITIDVYNLTGQLIQTFTDNAVISNQNRSTLPLTGYAPGVYFFILRGSSSGIMDKGKFLAEP